MPDTETYKIFFLEAPYSYGSGHIVVGKYFPLGIGYLAAYVRKHGVDVRIFQASQGPGHDDQVLREIREYKPDMVCISVMTPSYPGAVSLCSLIKRNHACVTVLGGHHVSAVGREVMEQSPDTDYAVIGEGEDALLKLVENIVSGQGDPAGVPGLVWRKKQTEIVQNPPAELIKDLDSLPFPARDLVDMNRFRLHSYIDFGKKSATMITSRGCPFKCMFCSSWLTMGSQYRFRSVDSIMMEIQELVEKFGVDHIVFEDDTMTLKRDRMLALCESLERMKNRPTWYCLSRVDSMDRDLALNMKRAGCRMVAFGIESGSPEVLKKIGKKITIDKARQAVDACRRAGLRTQCTFIVGFPFDTRDTMEMTFQQAKYISPTIAIFFPLTPYPGTQIYNEFLDEALRPHDVVSWERFLMTANSSGISVNLEFPGETIKQIADAWNRRFFFRPAQIINILRSVHGLSDIMRMARGGMYLLSTMVGKRGSG